MREDRERPVKYVLLGLCGSVLAMWVLGGIFRTRDPNVELAKTASRAVKMAEGARREAEITRKASSVFRSVALVVGISVPLIVAYLIYRLQVKEEPGAGEIIDVLGRERLVEMPEAEMAKLPRRDRLELEPSRHGGKDGPHNS